MHIISIREYHTFLQLYIFLPYLNILNNFILNKLCTVKSKRNYMHYFVIFQIQEVNNEIQEFIENRMRNNNPIDDKLSLFRQQVCNVLLFKCYCSSNILYT